MIPYGRQTIDEEDKRAVLEVLSSDWLTQGPNVAGFEEDLSLYTGVRYASAVANGTVALHLAYSAFGIKEGDEVITTPNTFVATTNMLLALGAKPVFVDIRMDTYNIDEGRIEEAITERTKAIVPVHFAGHPCEMDVIMNIAKKYNLKVIEDSCHALGASYKGKKIGSFGDAGVMSFHPLKSITTGEGGAVFTNSKEIDESVKLMRSHGIRKDKNGFNVMETFGYNYRITDMQCALGSSQLKKLDSFIEKRRSIANQYKEMLGGVAGIVLPQEAEGVRSSWHIYVIRTERKEDRIPLYNFLKAKGIGVNFHYPPVYSHPYYVKNGFENFSLPNADLYAKTSITIPIFPCLSMDEVVFVTETIKWYFVAKS